MHTSRECRITYAKVNHPNSTCDCNDAYAPQDGNQLNWFTAYFNIGVIIGAPSSTTMLTVVRPRWWLPASTMIWSFLVIFMYKAKIAGSIYALKYTECNQIHIWADITPGFVRVSLSQELIPLLFILYIIFLRPRVK
jgi:hypothetical protein